MYTIQIHAAGISQAASVFDQSHPPLANAKVCKGMQYMQYRCDQVLKGLSFRFQIWLSGNSLMIQIPDLRYCMAHWLGQGWQGCSHFPGRLIRL